MTILNIWELNVLNKFLTEDEFLTSQTLEGLKITIKSTIKLIDYLHEECNFAYVLTNKTNQDCLEVMINNLLKKNNNNTLISIVNKSKINIIYKFFGIIRQVAGPNNHPTTPMFLQQYRMFSVYSKIKPSKSGNCCILEG